MCPTETNDPGAIAQTDLPPPHSGIIGYWSSVFAAIVLAEHVVFRRGDFLAYDLSQFNQPDLLPLGLAAVIAFCCAVGIVVPCMSQAWYTGPIARSGTGDIGILAGSAVALVVYLALRTLERSIFLR